MSKFSKFVSVDSTPLSCFPREVKYTMIRFWISTVWKSNNFRRELTRAFPWPSITGRRIVFGGDKRLIKSTGSIANAFFLQDL